MTLQIIDPQATAMARKIAAIAPPLLEIKIVGRSRLGKTGLQAALRRLPDVVWLNLDLPDTGGLGVLQQLVAASVVVVAASEWLTFAQETFDLGAVAFVPLPADDDLLRAVFVQAAERRQR